MSRESSRIGRLRWKAYVTTCVLAIVLASGARATPPDTAKTPPPKPAGGAPARGGPGGPPPQGFGYPHGFIERHAKRLELSEETVKALRETVEKSRAENERSRKQVEEAQNALRKLLAQDIPDEKAVMDQADKITALVGEQRKNQLRSAIKVRSMLTPKQRAELDKIRREQQAAARRGAGGPPPSHQRKPPFGAGPGPHGQPPPKAPPKPGTAQ